MFGNKKDEEEELKIKVSKWWVALPYLKKIEILLEEGTKPGKYPEYNISTIEQIGIRVFWNYNSLEKKAEIMKVYEQKKERS